MALGFGFYLNLLSLVIVMPIKLFYIRSICKSMDAGDKYESAMKKLSCFSGLLGIGQLALMITVLVVRFGHAGKVCTGDYMTDSEIDKIKSASSITSGLTLPLEDGDFLYAISIFYIISLSCCCCCACCFAVVGGSLFAG